MYLPVKQTLSQKLGVSLGQWCQSLEYKSAASIMILAVGQQKPREVRSFGENISPLIGIEETLQAKQLIRPVLHKHTLLQLFICKPLFKEVHVPPGEPPAPLEAPYNNLKSWEQT